MLRVCHMLKVNFGTAESKLKEHIGTDHSICVQRLCDLAEKQNLLSAVLQFTFSSPAIHYQHFPYSPHRSAPSRVYVKLSSIRCSVATFAPSEPRPATRQSCKTARMPYWPNRAKYGIYGHGHVQYKHDIDWYYLKEH